MFTWICPKCGGEVPPSYDDCPRCSPPARTAVSPTEPVEAPAQASAPPAVAPRLAPAEVRPIAVDTPPAAAPIPAPRGGLPSSVVAILAAVGIIGLLAVLYLYVLPTSKQEAPGSSQAPALESPAAASAARAAHPLAKYLEVTGVRVSEGRDGRARIQFVVVNHSAADLPEMNMQLSIRSGDKAFFDFPVKVPSLGPWEVKDLNTTVRTDLKPYELPDWQMIRPQFRIVTEP